MMHKKSSFKPQELLKVGLKSALAKEVLLTGQTAPAVFVNGTTITGERTFRNQLDISLLLHVYHLVALIAACAYIENVSPTPPVYHFLTKAWLKCNHSNQERRSQLSWQLSHHWLDTKQIQQVSGMICFFFASGNQTIISLHYKSVTIKNKIKFVIGIVVIFSEVKESQPLSPLNCCRSRKT